MLLFDYVCFFLGYCGLFYVAVKTNVRWDGGGFAAVKIFLLLSSEVFVHDKSLSMLIWLVNVSKL